MESAERPLVIVGKGMAWSRAEDEVREFIERTQLPFLASPMGKGVMPDDHALSVGAARTHALKDADVIFLMGARLNWIMHFGLPPRFSKDVRIIQLDTSAEEIGNNVPAEVALVGDGKAIVSQLNRALEDRQWFYPAETDWRSALAGKAADNQASVQPMIDDDSQPMNYYRAFKDIREWLPENAIIVSEGANTMDIGRTQMPNSIARSRLDAGSYGTMGVGMGFAIAAATVHPDRPVVAVEGDSGFGFSGMEVETMCRYKMPVKIVILNNGGIGGGMDELPTDKPIPAPILTPRARYDLLMEAFGGRGFLVEDPKDLRATLDEAMAFDGPAIVNVLIDPKAGRKPQQFAWLTKEE
jgi:2-hydroxyacyl-CoA lyase 1